MIGSPRLCRIAMALVAVGACAATEVAHAAVSADVDVWNLQFRVSDARPDDGIAAGISIEGVKREGQVVLQ